MPQLTLRGSDLGQRGVVGLLESSRSRHFVLLANIDRFLLDVGVATAEMHQISSCPARRK